MTCTRSLPTADEVCAWSPDERAAVSRMLEACIEAPTPSRRSRRRVLVLGVGVVGAVFMVPWLIFLSATLPDQSSVDSWRATWVGFDIALAAAFAATALTVWYRRQLATFMMVVTATLLVCDAWFDMCLSWGTDEQWGSIATAGVELPLAVLLVSSAAAALRHSHLVLARIRGLDPKPVPLWKQPMLLRPNGRGLRGRSQFRDSTVPR